MCVILWENNKVEADYQQGVNWQKRKACWFVAWEHVVLLHACWIVDDSVRRGIILSGGLSFVLFFIHLLSFLLHEASTVDDFYSLWAWVSPPGHYLHLSAEITLHDAARTLLNAFDAAQVSTIHYRLQFLRSLSNNKCMKMLLRLYNIERFLKLVQRSK